MNKNSLKKWAAITLVLVIIAGAAAFLVGSDLARAQGNGPGGSERDFESEEESSDQFTRATGELKPLYHFANVLNDEISSIQEGTAIMCTNLDETESTEVEVQLYQYTGDLGGTGIITIDPFETATFESNTITFYSADVVMDVGFIEQGYGRILTQHKNVVCTVQILDADNSPPTWMENIPVWGHSGWGSYLPMITN